MAGEVNFLDYILTIFKWRKFIVLNFVIVCVLALILSFILPKWYTARTTVLPPEEQTMGIGLPSMLANLSLGSVGFPGITTPGAIYVAILESRTVRERVIQKVDLMRIYKSKNMEEAVKKLSKKTDIEISEEGVVELRATARNPQRAADIANSYVAELDKKNTELNVAQAKDNRVFLEERLAENKEALSKAEEDFRNFQEVHKAIALPEQTAAAIEAAAGVIGEMQMLEVKRDVLLATMKPTNPNVMQIQTEIEALRKQLDRMEFGADEELDTMNTQAMDRRKEIYVPFSEVPSVGLELARLTRELKIQEVIFELLTSQYEQAKIQEAKDTPTVQIIDRAVPPQKRSKPVRSVIVLFGGGLSIVLSIIFIAFVEFYQGLKTRRPEDYNRLHGVLMDLKKDADFSLKKIGLRKRTKI